jgi:hypothetical protein
MWLNPVGLRKRLSAPTVTERGCYDPDWRTNISCWRPSNCLGSDHHRALLVRADALLPLWLRPRRCNDNCQWSLLERGRTGRPKVAARLHECLLRVQSSVPRGRHTLRVRRSASQHLIRERRRERHKLALPAEGDLDGPLSWTKFDLGFHVMTACSSACIDPGLDPLLKPRSTLGISVATMHS